MAHNFDAETVENWDERLLGIALQKAFGRQPPLTHPEVLDLIHAVKQQGWVPQSLLFAGQVELREELTEAKNSLRLVLEERDDQTGLIQKLEAEIESLRKKMFRNEFINQPVPAFAQGGMIGGGPASPAAPVFNTLRQTSWIQ